MNIDDIKPFIEEKYSLSITNLNSLNPKNTLRATKVTTTKGDFVLRVFSLTREDAVKTDIIILNFLKQQTFPASQIIKTHDGESFFIYANYIGILTTFIEGTPPTPSETTFSQIGELMARLHTLPLSSDLPVSSWNVVSQKELTHENNDKLSSHLMKHQELIPTFLHAFDLLPTLEDLPSVLIHTDIGINNLVVNPDGKLSLIDWDDAGVGKSVIDIGNILSQTLISFSGSESNAPEFNESYAIAFLKGYHKVRSLTTEEKENLITGMQFCALSYVLQDWIPKIDMQNWIRYQYTIDHKEELQALFNR